jgi:hypothetical protein
VLLFGESSCKGCSYMAHLKTTKGKSLCYLVSISSVLFVHITQKLSFIYWD